jgi:hypothetical protein
MKPGRYAAADGSFGRSAGAAMGRGVALLAVALLIGVLLLNKTDERPPGSDVAAGPGPATGAESGEDGDDRRATTTTSTTTTAAARQPKDVKVVVANGSEVKGAAGRASDQLKAAGYNVLAPTNVSPSVATSTAYYTPGYERETIAVAAALGMPQSVVKLVTSPPPFDAKTANVLVVLGADHANRFAAASGGAAGSTTTARAGAAASTTTTTSR